MRYKTQSEKLFNDSYYSTETLGPDECAIISEMLGLEGEDAVEPNWRPICCGVISSLDSDKFFCPVCLSSDPRDDLSWVWPTQEHGLVEPL